VFLQRHFDMQVGFIGIGVMGRPPKGMQPRLSAEQKAQIPALLAKGDH
jgi:hypothetical protein